VQIRCISSGRAPKTPARVQICRKIRAGIPVSDSDLVTELAAAMGQARLTPAQLIQRVRRFGAVHSRRRWKSSAIGTLVANRTVFDLSASAENILISERCLKAFDEHGIRGLIEPQPIGLQAVEGPFELATLGTLLLGADAVGR